MLSTLLSQFAWDSTVQHWTHEKNEKNSMIQVKSRINFAILDAL